MSCGDENGGHWLTGGRGEASWFSLATPILSLTHSLNVRGYGDGGLIKSDDQKESCQGTGEHYHVRDRDTRICWTSRWKQVALGATGAEEVVSRSSCRASPCWKVGTGVQIPCRSYLARLCSHISYRNIDIINPSDSPYHIELHYA